MLQVAHCMRISGEIARINGGRLSKRERSELKKTMDQAFTERGN